jgi:hypothetical protein
MNTAVAMEDYMSVIFNVIDKIHNIIVKYVPAYLPEAKKPYNLKPVHQPALDIHGVASKADVYNVTTDPSVIEAGLNDGLRLMRYLAADGYRITTPLFSLRIRVPGEYDGSENSLPDGVHPVVRLRSSADYREYVKERVKIDFSGIEPPKGRIAGFLDIEENEYKTIFVPGDQFLLTGSGIKVAGDNPSRGVYFVPEDDPAHEVRVTRIARNSQSEIIGICPQTGHLRNKIVIGTQYSGNSKYLKTIRTIESSFVIEEA